MRIKREIITAVAQRRLRETILRLFPAAIRCIGSDTIVNAMSVSPQRQLGWSNISIKRAPQKMASRRMVSYGLKLADWNGAEVRFGSKADMPS